MKQNLVSLEFSAAQLQAVDAALAVLEENLVELVTLTAVQRRKALTKPEAAALAISAGGVLSVRYSVISGSKARPAGSAARIRSR